MCRDKTGIAMLSSFSPAAGRMIPSDPPNVSCISQYLNGRNIYFQNSSNPGSYRSTSEDDLLSD